MLPFGATIFLSSLLLFLVQPIIARQILPWFGGSSAVWATCLVFSQSALLAGYAYADVVVRRLSIRDQIGLHTILLIASLLWLPIVPAVSWKPSGGEGPILQIIGLLLATIGLPYIMLSTTSPIVQAWYWRRFSTRAPYRLFALSNVASLLALVVYPTLIEPWCSTGVQTWGWSMLYGLFVLLCGSTGFHCLRHRNAAVALPLPNETEASQEPGAISFSKWNALSWFMLSATGSCLLLAVSNHITQNVAAVPFLWILPLALYLLSFILAFDHPRWYVRPVFLVALAVLVPAMAYNLDSLDLKKVVLLYTAGLFAGCMFCHGEIVRLKPEPRYLTIFYLVISLGGAVGSLLVGVLAPLTLPGYYELGIVLVAMGGLTLMRMWPTKILVGLAATVTAGTAVFVWSWADAFSSGARLMKRNFYGVVRTIDFGKPAQFRGMYHGSIMHGGQLLKLDVKRTPSTYFGSRSGYGRLFAALTDERPRRIGVIGLGTGALAVYCRAQDTMVFYELDSQVIDVSRAEFTFLDDTPGKIEIVLGDGRLSLEREEPRRYDVLAIDAFSGDSIPMHLLTREAMAVYLKHLQPDGAIVFQATNRYIELAPVVASLAKHANMSALVVSNLFEQGADGDWQFPSEQIILTRNESLIKSDPISTTATELHADPNFEVFTDDYSNLFRILR